MEVIGRSRAHTVLESCLNDSFEYFEQHEKILKCNPYCTNVACIPGTDVYQWTFQVEDPRKNPITAIFFVQQQVEPLEADEHKVRQCLKVMNNSELHDGRGKRIRWVHAEDAPVADIGDDHTFVGKANTEICLLHQKDNRTAVHFETDIALDFTLSFPLNMMPEGVLKFMSETIMSQIMQQATESMLCQLQSDICCAVPADLRVEGGKR
ncbi:DUF1997 domain-containing protein [Prosthecochloris sp. N3]|uniref:DUF1997 domain-containing protein n=1 Tax=Prosthecochloris ethylica TaxID=2743976 RepID=A0ABR9XQY7_9CHLB|nr:MULTISPECIES: DUF1997 domain-containing protein [Prosthecochloris]MEC9486172.1 DUF1997 domain-containing protein [Prosthecochloris sp.]MBF0586388.1 DUF1997 domain-containing protein [Prosthecochloris ethylica]MBF0636394.1 DUF1997 domain-containing protein [Prosthecochloris ethylica]NUK47568.1 DUF1997 domain-containing protein [Prosthecochloris ethylica]RNA64184.1 DUF1997 domain-containing protein [Prosthecochloris sp. ZM_2]